MILKKLIIWAWILLILVPLCIGCSRGGTLSQSSDSETIPPLDTNEYGYEYPTEGFDGRSLVVLNTESQWSYFVALDFEGSPAEPVSSAIVNRNRQLETRFDFVLDVRLVQDFDELDDTISELYASSDDVYDIAYVPICRQPRLITDGAFTDLNTIESLNLDQEWWDPSMHDALNLNGKMYLATSAFQLSAYDGTWALFFNEDILIDRQIELPYDLVREGAWTLDKFNEYVVAVTDLNGDESYAWNENGRAVYGVAAHEDSVNYFARGAGIVYAKSSEDGGFIVESGSEQYFDVFEKLAYSLDETTGRTHVGSIHTQYSYISCFTTGRALFFPSAMDSCRSLLRDLNFGYGVLPFPKYNEQQTDYYSLLDVYSLYMSIPSQNDDLEIVGQLIDLLSFESYRTVVPVYYDIAVEQKGLINEDARSMLPYLTAGRTTDIALLYNAAEQLRGETAQKIYRGDYGSLASLLDSQRTGIERRLLAMFGNV